MSIDKRPDGKWRARYRGLDGREHSKHFDRKADAEKFQAIQKAAVARGDWINPAGGAITFAEWSKEWLKTKSVRPKTLVGYESTLGVHLIPRWGTYRLRHIGHVEIAQWLRELLDGGLRPATVRSAYIVLTMILNLAVEAELLPKNPARKVKAPTVHPRKPQVLTQEQVFALAEAAGDYRTFILLLAYTGLRWGEATALQRSHFDLGNRVVHVDRAFSDVPGMLLPGPTKNHQRRIVPLPSFLIPLLEEQFRGRAVDGLAFTAPGGGPLHLSNFRHKYFDPARVSAGALTARAPSPAASTRSACCLPLSAPTSQPVVCVALAISVWVSR
jgi:integrase